MRLSSSGGRRKASSAPISLAFAHPTKKVRRVDGIHDLGRGRPQRLVKQLERHAGRRIGIVPGELLPQAVKLRTVGRGIGGELMEVVDIHDDVKTVGRRGVDQGIHGGEERV